MAIREWLSGRKRRIGHEERGAVITRPLTPKQHLVVQGKDGGGITGRTWGASVRECDGTVSLEVTARCVHDRCVHY